MNPYRMGRDHAHEYLLSLGSLKDEIDGIVYFDKEAVWPGVGPYSWEAYIQGANSVLSKDGSRRVVGGLPMTGYTPFDVPGHAPA